MIQALVLLSALMGADGMSVQSVRGSGQALAFCEPMITDTATGTVAVAGPWNCGRAFDSTDPRAVYFEFRSDGRTLVCFGVRRGKDGALVAPVERCAG